MAPSIGEGPSGRFGRPAFGWDDAVSRSEETLTTADAVRARGVGRGGAILDAAEWLAAREFGDPGADARVSDAVGFGATGGRDLVRGVDEFMGLVWALRAWFTAAMGCVRR